MSQASSVRRTNLLTGFAMVSTYTLASVSRDEEQKTGSLNPETLADIHGHRI